METTMPRDVVPIKGGRDLAARRGDRRYALTVLDEPLSEATTAFGTALACHDQVLEIEPVRDLPTAKAARRAMWPRARAVDSAAWQLFQMSILDPGERWGRIDGEEAARMFALVHGTLKRRSGDPVDEAAWLRSIVTMFTPEANDLARVTRGANPLPLHRTVVALCVQRLISNATFIPVPAEVREAAFKCYAHANKLRAYADGWLAMAKRAERIVFEQDRENWRKVYTTRAALDVLCSLTHDSDSADMNHAYNVLDDEIAAKETGC
jgi:hypothetical protein